jgi:hypothetical protein
MLTDVCHILNVSLGICACCLVMSICSNTALMVHAVSQLVEALSTSRKVADSIPDQMIGFFNLPNPSSRIMALKFAQTLTEMSTRNFPGS